MADYYVFKIDFLFAFLTIQLFLQYGRYTASNVQSFSDVFAFVSLILFLGKAVSCVANTRCLLCIIGEMFLFW